MAWFFCNTDSICLPIKKRLSFLVREHAESGTESLGDTTGPEGGAYPPPTACGLTRSGGEDGLDLVVCLSLGFGNGGDHEETAGGTATTVEP